ncbi:hypothetical protein [Paenibacillus thalictri]|uniref:Uncharacterized protein n=1 Tax=Paenibacillus thalictri TaxID=2527873 RepID=A0A4Q9DF55_9BACL|nr:hypothetical protein [Paenibacillus thalictri]TBL68281.1 hypothetical protein EYB31_38490 [Paenibacillus thalictri]
MSNIILPSKALDMGAELRELAAEWNFTVTETAEGYLLQPEYMLCLHGIYVDEENQGWRFSREMEATTWEDFLLMHVTHRLAAKHALLLEYDLPNGIRLTEPTPEHFESFDSYAEQVVSKEEGWLKEMKKNWIYTHRTRNVR